MNRAELAKEVARREALGAAWNASAKELREELDRQARAEHAEQGTGVTWTIRDLGKVTLPVSTEAPIVSDIDALLKWVRQRHPEHVETVEQVQAAFQTWLLQNVEITEDSKVVSPDGEIVPGMAVREGNRPKSLTITIDAPVKKLFASYAQQEVERQLVAEYGPATQEPEVAEVRCVGCGKPIRDGEPIDMIGDAYSHAGDGCGTEWDGA
jgi:hypothetical protein